ncbi:hypothetical protein U1Q18_004302 [Sarracenia purpurea var. burkii]
MALSLASTTTNNELPLASAPTFNHHTSSAFNYTVVDAPLDTQCPVPPQCRPCVTCPVPPLCRRSLHAASPIAGTPLSVAHCAHSAAYHSSI